MDAVPDILENMDKRKERTWAFSDPLARDEWQSLARRGKTARRAK